MNIKLLLTISVMCYGKTPKKIHNITSNIKTQKNSKKTGYFSTLTPIAKTAKTRFKTVTANHPRAYKASVGVIGIAGLALLAYKTISTTSTSVNIANNIPLSDTSSIVSNIPAEANNIPVAKTTVIKPNAQEDFISDAFKFNNAFIAFENLELAKLQALMNHERQNIEVDIAHKALVALENAEIAALQALMHHERQNLTLLIQSHRELSAIAQNILQQSHREAQQIRIAKDIQTFIDTEEKARTALYNKENRRITAQVLLLLNLESRTMRNTMTRQESDSFSSLMQSHNNESVALMNRIVNAHRAAELVQLQNTHNIFQFIESETEARNQVFKAEQNVVSYIRSYIRNIRKFDMTYRIDTNAIMFSEDAVYSSMKYNERVEFAALQLKAQQEANKQLTQQHDTTVGLLHTQQEENKELIAAFQNTTEDNHVLREALSASRSESAVLQQELATSRSELAIAQKELYETISERDQASSRASSALEALSASRSESAVLQQELATSRSESIVLQEALEIARSESAILQQELDEAHAHAINLQRTIEELQSYNKYLEDTNKTLLKKIDTLKLALDEKEEVRAQLFAEKQTLNENLQDAYVKKNTANRACETIQSRIKKIQAEKKALTKQITKANKQYKRHLVLQLRTFVESEEIIRDQIIANEVYTRDMMSQTLASDVMEQTFLNRIDAQYQALQKKEDHMQKRVDVFTTLFNHIQLATARIIDKVMTVSASENVLDTSVCETLSVVLDDILKNMNTAIHDLGGKIIRATQDADSKVEDEKLMNAILREQILLSQTLVPFIDSMTQYATAKILEQQELLDVLQNDYSLQIEQTAINADESAKKMDKYQGFIKQSIENLLQTIRDDLKKIQKQITGSNIRDRELINLQSKVKAMEAFLKTISDFKTNIEKGYDATLKLGSINPSQEAAERVMMNRSSRSGSVRSQVSVVAITRHGSESNFSEAVTPTTPITAIDTLEANTDSTTHNEAVSGQVQTTQDILGTNTDTAAHESTLQKPTVVQATSPATHRTPLGTRTDTNTPTLSKTSTRTSPVPAFMRTPMNEVD